METKEIKTILFKSYINTICDLVNRYNRDFERNKERFNRKTFKESLEVLNKLYRNQLVYLNLDEFGKRDCFRDPTEEEFAIYKCSQDNSNNSFPLIKILEYRNKKFPEFLDDYGMGTFIEVIGNDGGIISIQTNDSDWDYMLDKILYVENLADMQYSDICNLFLSDPAYKVN